MIKHKDYYYKGFDIDSKNSLEKKQMEYFNPYGYNIDSNLRRVIDYEKECSRTNQDSQISKFMNIKK